MDTLKKTEASADEWHRANVQRGYDAPFEESCAKAAVDGRIDLSRDSPGKPNENAYLESFNRKFRDECLNEHWFLTMAHARRIIEPWRIEYNTERLRSSLGNLTPQEFAEIRFGERERKGTLTRGL